MFMEGRKWLAPNDHRAREASCQARRSLRRPAHNENAASDDEASGEQEADPTANEESGEQEPTPHREPVPHVHDRLPRIRDPPAAYSIAEFCRAHRISQSMYFKLRGQGLGPREMSVGSRKLISLEAAAAWRRARERKATTA
jgi:hypothetical protein